MKFFLLPIFTWVRGNHSIISGGKWGGCRLLDENEWWPSKKRYSWELCVIVSALLLPQDQLKRKPTPANPDCLLPSSRQRTLPCQIHWLNYLCDHSLIYFKETWLAKQASRNNLLFQWFMLAHSNFNSLESNLNRSSARKTKDGSYWKQSWAGELQQLQEKRYSQHAVLNQGPTKYLGTPVLRTPGSPDCFKWGY